MNDVVVVTHPFAELVDLQVSDRGEGACTTTLHIQEKHTNPHGVVHGAVIYALADTGMGGALTSLLEESEYCSTIEIKINYFRPGISGLLTCKTRILNKGKRTAALSSEVFNNNDQLVAAALGTFMINQRE